MFTEKISLSVEPGQMAIDPLLSVTPFPSETRCGSRFPLPHNAGLRHRGIQEERVAVWASLLGLCCGQSGPLEAHLCCRGLFSCESWKEQKKYQTEVQILPLLFCDLRLLETQLFSFGKWGQYLLHGSVSRQIRKWVSKF